MRIKSFTQDPGDVGAYGPVTDEGGSRRLELEVEEVRGDIVIAALSGVRDRAEAEALKGLRLYVPRAVLPEPDEDEYYHSDLLGLRAELADGTAAGVVRAVIPVGATEVLEIDPGPGTETLLVPFTKAAVPEIDLGGGRLVIVPPRMTGGDGPAEDEDEEGRGKDAAEDDGTATDEAGTKDRT